MTKLEILDGVSVKKLLLAFMLLASFVFLFSVFSPSTGTAQAAQTCVGGSKASCFNGTLSWSGGNSSGGLGKNPKPPGVGSGQETATSAPPPRPCVRASLSSPYWSSGNVGNHPSAYKTNESTCHKIFILDPAWVDGESSECKPIKQNGFTIKSVGHYITFKAPVRFIYERDSWYVAYVYDEFWITCTYPKSTITASAKECALSAKVSIVREKNSAGGYKKLGLTPASKTYATMKELTGSNAKSKCVTSASMSFATNIDGSSQKNWGQYSLGGDIKYAVCNEVTMKFDGKTTYNYSCAGPKNGPAVSQKMTLWCGGVSRSWISKKWTAEDCVGSAASGRSTVCTPPQATFDGKKGNVQTLRDGKTRVLDWGAYKVKNNVKNVRNWKHHNVLLSGSSPWDTSVGVNDTKKQLFYSPQKFNAWTALGRKQNLAFYQASIPGKGFNIQRTQKFDAEFLVKVTNFKSYNPWTGKVVTSTSNKWVKGSGISCPKQVSPKIQPIRTIGDAL